MSLFGNAITVLESLGFFSVVLPFLLIYSIVYGTLVRTKIFGEGAAQINAMVAFTIALIFVAAANVVDVMSTFIPWVGLIAIFVVSAMMLSVLILGGDIEAFAKQYKAPAIGLIIVAMFYALFSVAGWFEAIGDSLFSSKGDLLMGIVSVEDLLGVVVLLGIIGAMMVVTKGGTKGGGGK